ncbi:MAG: CmcI family methyltransferase [Phycisphaerae bacterium]
MFSKIKKILGLNEAEVGPAVEEHLDMPLKDVLQIMQRGVKKKTSYFGIKTLKNPLDFWVYQQIIYEIKPDVIIEIGNLAGGSALALAHFLDNMQKGRIIAVDIDHSLIDAKTKQHPRITLVTADAVASFETVKPMINEGEKVLIIEDSAHTYDNTLCVLEKFSSLVSVGSYFIIEDSICHHGVDDGPSPGPYEAIEKFISENSSFEIDRSKEAYMITWNPKGFLKRKK